MGCCSSNPMVHPSGGYGQSADLRAILAGGKGRRLSLPPSIDLTNEELAHNANEITGTLWGELLRAGFAHLRKNKDHLNKTNVFPIPDGDTGNNCVATLRDAVHALGAVPPRCLCDVTKSFALQAALASMGNSGTILTFFFTGLADEVERRIGERDSLTVEELSSCLSDVGGRMDEAMGEAAKAGTLLSVIRDACTAPSLGAASSVLNLFESWAKEGNTSLQRTPEQLNVNGKLILKAAGVVDSGAQAWVYLLDGALLALRGQLEYGDYMLQSVATGEGVDAQFGEDGCVDPHGGCCSVGDDVENRYCTECVLELRPGVERSELEHELESHGDSRVVVINKLSPKVTLAKVHIHARDPKAAFVACRGLSKDGVLFKEKSEDMRAQMDSKKNPLHLPKLPGDNGFVGPADGDKGVRCSVVISSYAALPAEMYEAWAERVVPLRCNVDGEMYKDRVEMTPLAMRNLLRRRGYTSVGTSQWQEEELEAMILRIAQQPTVREVLTITLPRSMSETTGVAERVKARIREATGVRVVTYVHRGAGEGAYVMRAHYMASRGHSAAEIIAALDSWTRQRTTGVFGLVRTLRFIRASGRAEYLNRGVVGMYIDHKERLGHSVVSTVLITNRKNASKPPRGAKRPDQTGASIKFYPRPMADAEFVQRVVCHVQKFPTRTFDVLIEHACDAHDYVPILEAIQEAANATSKGCLRHVYVAEASALIGSSFGAGYMTITLWKSDHVEFVDKH